MNILRSAVLYMALAAGAISQPAVAQDVSALLTGEMNKLALHETPKPLDTSVIWEDGASLADYRGKWVLLNFWAIWCAPCREEMPTLDALQREMGGEEFAVVTLATGPNAVPAIDKFFDETGVETLPKHRDPSSAQARGAGVLGLPVTMIVNPQGEEVGRLIGGADWNSQDARALLAALMAGA